VRHDRGSFVTSETGLSVLHEVTVSEARNLRPIFDEAVRDQHPVVIVRGGREQGLLVGREQLLRLLSSYRFHVDVIPEDIGGFTLWLRELEIGGNGPTLREARADLLAAARSYATNYLAQIDFYRHIPDLVAREPYVLRVALARDKAELERALFESQAPSTTSTIDSET
jgi:hypothetical protein